MSSSSELVARRKQWNAFIGAVLALVGIALIALATPADNALLKVRHSAQMDLSHPKNLTTLPTAMRKWERRTPLSDVKLTFSMRLMPGWNAKKPETFVPITTLGNRSGMKFVLTAYGTLSVILGTNTKILSPQEVLIAKKLRANQTVNVAAKIQRSQSFDFSVAGKAVQAFMFDSPVYRAAPQELRFTTTPDIVVRRVHIETIFYTSDSGSLTGIMMRVAQVIGILSLIAGVVIILQRYLVSVFRHSGAKIILVRVAFSVMGLGEVANILIDMAHPYASPSRYVDYNTWLFSQYPRFSDFFQVDELLRSLAPYGVSAGSYPPFGYLILSPVAWFSQYTGLFIFLSSCIAFIAWWLWTTFAAGSVMRWEAVTIAMVGILSLPVTFAIDRANVDLLVFIMICVAIALFERRALTGSALFVGLAAAAKIFPALYFALFVRRKRLRYLIVGAVGAAIVTVVGLMVFHGSILSNVAGFRSAQSQYAASLNAPSNVQGSTYYNASIFAAMQAISLWVGGTSAAIAVHGYIYHYSTAIYVIAMAATAIWTWRSDGRLWRNVGVATIVAVLFSPLSGYYSLLLLFVPLALLVRQARVTGWTVALAAIYGFILAPRAWWYISGGVDVSVAMTGPLLLLALVVTVWADHEPVSAPALLGDEARLVARSSGRGLVSRRRQGEEDSGELLHKPVGQTSGK